MVVYCKICGSVLQGTAMSCPNYWRDDHRTLKCTGWEVKQSYVLSDTDFELLQEKIDNPDDPNKNLKDLFNQFLQ